MGLAIGSVVLASWALGWDAAKNVLPGSVSMKANAALAFVLVGGGMLLGAGSGSCVAAVRGTDTGLVVDDVEGLRRLAERMLGSAGYTVITAGGGPEALTPLESREVELVVADVVMPGMSGVQWAEELARPRPRTRVIFMSGYADDVILRHGVSDASVQLLNEPFTAAELTRAARAALDRPDAGD
jgi:CheY-like chemotaxis protein